MLQEQKLGTKAIIATQREKGRSPGTVKIGRYVDKQRSANELLACFSHIFFWC